MENKSAQIAALAERISQTGTYLHIDDKRAELAELEALSAEAGFWDDRSRAEGIMRKASDLRSDIQAFDDATEKVADIEVANELACMEDDAELAEEVEQGIEELVAAIDELELSSWFTGEFDHGDAIVNINPGQGGLEAQDWTDMLFHLYLRYAERKGWKTTINDAPSGEVIGLDRATFTVKGHNAYGMLSAEQGVHRLVRISPTDDKKRRQTTFAGVEVLPVIPEDIEVEINPDDLRIDVYHSSGHGGQGVNTTDSAVRITHNPTGIVVTCQNERSQIQNKATAMGILRAKLYELEQEKREAELDELRGPKHEISFGNQIRSYVLYPYQMVKDLRTGVETGNVDAVLDGEIDQFIIEYHRWRVLNKG
ncbi:MAG: peptide chain release factor 2 [Actinomycetota bacterium]|nr:peptide chain release factor 2 [Actinomycetota bacterium]